MRFFLLLLMTVSCLQIHAQRKFYTGADLSYVNEMDDCGVAYKVNGEVRDAYEIFKEQGANMVRLRLWHTPAWHDTLNTGKRYGDLADVKKSIRRAKDQGLRVLLDFHLSDFWADPERQIVPAAWEAVVDDTEILGDSVYNYVNATLLELNSLDLMPEMVQVGNETNKGILQTEAADASGFILDWPRNASLFNKGIKAVRDAARETEKDIQVAIHVAGPENASWLMAGFKKHGVTDFDVVGLSYYWAWHQPTTTARTGQIITELKDSYGKEVMIFETGYIWTLESNDTADNIIGSVQTGYSPASPANQRRWLIDLTQEVYDRGGLGVLYWEPAWVSSPCFTPWGQGSHQEHASFFDFDSNLLEGGGADFLAHNYSGSTSTSSVQRADRLKFTYQPAAREIWLVGNVLTPDMRVELVIMDTLGRTLRSIPVTLDGVGRGRAKLDQHLTGATVILAVSNGVNLGGGVVVL
ncbi:glycoside hydrolase family 53 protein [Neolewinella antarctica]|uniref:Arabinogalactan endo-beta-1,4-galactanase n=1 Tax=Neolewinella antarctica TaxID=442734 RepID=A0ABX0XA88_9BACT|nr:glycosyl hydrolase 53 family protein [Neolewinella antarctica]NJC26184.1 arabinogalactan endo-1,4-beta-galactosidase [Neolewinella antarctica]